MVGRAQAHWGEMPEMTIHFARHMIVVTDTPELSLRHEADSVTPCSGNAIPKGSNNAQSSPCLILEEHSGTGHAALPVVERGQENGGHGKAAAATVSRGACIAQCWLLRCSYESKTHEIRSGRECTVVGQFFGSSIHRILPTRDLCISSHAMKQIDEPV